MSTSSRQHPAHSGTASTAATESPGASAFFGVVVGTLTGFENAAVPLVAWGGRPAQAARTIVHLQPHHVGESVAVQFEDGDPARPLVMGIVKTASPMGSDALPDALSAARPLAVTVDDEHLLLTARRSITLQCGRASITLDDKGHVEIRGTYVLSRSSGQNRIKGTSVSLN